MTLLQPHDHALVPDQTIASNGTTKRKRRRRKMDRATFTKLKCRFVVVSFAFIVLACLAIAKTPTEFEGPMSAGGSRGLLSEVDCKSEDKESTATTVLKLVAILECFLGLAVICDDWFVPSLESISEVLDLSEDVAGATFMAAGGSAPELMTSVADTFSTENSIGVGTIVGSAMFNILVIVALSALVIQDAELLIDWRPMARDCFFIPSQS